MIAIKDRNHELATDEKTKIEDMQRDEAAKRHDDGVEWHPRFFRRVRGGPGGPEEGEEDLDWILNADMYVQKLISWIPWLTLEVTALHPKPRPSRSFPSRQSYTANNHRSNLICPLSINSILNSILSSSSNSRRGNPRTLK